jgi:hypothetical protein
MNRRNFDTKKIWNKQKAKVHRRNGSKNVQTKTDRTKKSFLESFKQINIKNLGTNIPNINEAINNFNDFKSGLNLEEIKQKYYEKSWFRKLKYKLLKTNFFGIFNGGIAIITILSLIIFFCYLAFFDQNFIIRSYTIEFKNNSYLNQTQVNKLVSQFHKKKLYSFVPNNQYFFINSVNLTTSAKEIFPEIQEVNVKDRIWPNKAVLEVSLTKANITLAVKENNQIKYWRVSSQGKILSEDKAGIWENLIIVEKPYSLVTQNSTINEKASLQNYSFVSEQDQLDRFELTQRIWNFFQQKNIKIVSTIYPSLVDNDIIFVTDNNTKIYLDSSAFDLEYQTKRLEQYLETENGGSKFEKHILENKIQYIDMRIPNKIFFCRRNEKCE